MVTTQSKHSNVILKKNGGTTHWVVDCCRYRAWGGCGRTKSAERHECLRNFYQQKGAESIGCEKDCVFNMRRCIRKDLTLEGCKSSIGLEMRRGAIVFELRFFWKVPFLPSAAGGGSSLRVNASWIAVRKLFGWAKHANIQSRHVGLVFPFRKQAQTVHWFQERFGRHACVHYEFTDSSGEGRQRSGSALEPFDSIASSTMVNTTPWLGHRRQGLMPGARHLGFQSGA